MEGGLLYVGIPAVTLYPLGFIALGREGDAAAERIQRRCEKLAGYRLHLVLPSVRARVGGSCC